VTLVRASAQNCSLATGISHITFGNVRVNVTKPWCQSRDSPVAFRGTSKQMPTFSGKT